MPPRNDNDRIDGTLKTIRFILPGGTETELSGVEIATVEDEVNTPHSSFPIHFNSAEAETTGTINASVCCDLARLPDQPPWPSYLSKYFVSSAEAFRNEIFGDWLHDVNLVWENLGDDYELGDEGEYTPTDPISYEELMDFGGESK